MAYVPVILDDGSFDVLHITARAVRGSGDILVSGLVSCEVENEIQKAIRSAIELAELGEFPVPDLSTANLRIHFECRRSRLPVTGHSYGLGVGIELLRLFSARSWNDNFCATGGIGECGESIPVEGVEQKLHGAAKAGFERIFLPTSQLDFFNKEIRQVPVGSIFEAWGVLSYGQ